MPRNGSGTYSAPASSWNPAVDAQDAETDDFNGLLDDLSDALTESISTDGTSQVSADIPMGSHKLTGLSAGTTNGDSVRYEQLAGYQPLDATLTAIAALTVANGDLIKATGTDTFTTVAIGTSGAVVPLLNANNTHSGNLSFSGTNTHSGAETFSNTATFENTVYVKGSDQDLIYLKSNAGTDSFGIGRSISGDNAQDFFIYDAVAGANRLGINSSGFFSLRGATYSREFNVKGTDPGVRLQTANYAWSMAVGLFSSGDNVWSIVEDGANAARLVIFPITGHVTPASDGGQNCGASNLRWNTIFATTGSINTSDETEKTDLRQYTEAEARAIRRAVGSGGVFRWLSAIRAKGEAAREHFGIGAQTAERIFREEGLDPRNYGFFCADLKEEHIEIEEEYEEQATETVLVSKEERVFEGDRWVAKIVYESVERPIFDIVPLWTEKNEPIAGGHSVPRMVKKVRTRRIMRPVLDENGAQVEHYGVRYEELMIAYLSVLEQEAA